MQKNVLLDIALTWSELLAQLSLMPARRMTVQLKP